MKKKKGEGGGGSNWMDTYADMITLLMCFFIMLYSMSTLDQQKWQVIVQSFNPDSIIADNDMVGGGGEIILPPSSETTEPTPEDIMALLAQRLESYIEEQGAGQSITVTAGDGYVFISLDDAVFFDGDSYALRREGRTVLDDVGAMLESAKDAIDEIRVLGHTAQATATEPNNPTVDRFLASNRATVVVIYLQENTTLDPARLVSQGYGQWRPIASNTDPGERAKNRRVEMIVTGVNLGGDLVGGVSQYYTTRGIAPPDAGSANGAPAP